MARQIKRLPSFECEMRTATGGVSRPESDLEGSRRGAERWINDSGRTVPATVNGAIATRADAQRPECGDQIYRHRWRIRRALNAIGGVWDCVTVTWPVGVKLRSGAMMVDVGHLDLCAGAGMTMRASRVLVNGWPVLVGRGNRPPRMHVGSGERHRYRHESSADDDCKRPGHSAEYSSARGAAIVGTTDSPARGLLELRARVVRHL